jgi:capsular polysaccharide transport system permease protein
MTFSDFSSRWVKPLADWGPVRQAARSVAEFREHMREPLEMSGRVIFALFLRESRVRYGARTAGYVWALLVPAALLAGLLIIFTSLGRGSPAGEYMSVFFLTGIVPVRLWRNLLRRGASAISSNQALMNYPQVRPLHIVAARALLEIGTMAVVALVFAIVLSTFFGVPLTAWMDEPLKVFAALGGIALFCLGTIMVSAQLGRISTLWNDSTMLLGRLAFFVTGVFFTLQNVPEHIRKYVLLNPMAHMVEWLRDGVIPGFESTLYNPWYGVIWGLILVFVGLVMEWMIHISSFEDN